MSGILANSVSVDQSASALTNTGYITGEQITFTLDVTGASHSWSLAKPTASTSRCSLSATTGASVTMVPDVEGYYVVTCRVDTMTYRIRISAVDVAPVTFDGARRWVGRLAASVPAPSHAGDRTQFLDSSDSRFKLKDSTDAISEFATPITARDRSDTALQQETTYQFKGLSLSRISGRIIADAGHILVTEFPGVDPTGATDSSAAAIAADSDAATSGSTLVWPPGIYQIDADLVGSADWDFKGGVLVPSAGVTVTLDGAMTGSKTRQRWDVSAAGSSVVLGDDALADAIYASWWGVRAGEDVTAALQACVDQVEAVATNANFGKTISIILPRGKLYLSATIEVRTRGVRLVGQGWGTKGTQFWWIGPTVSTYASGAVANASSVPVLDSSAFALGDHVCVKVPNRKDDIVAVVIEKPDATHLRVSQLPQDQVNVTRVTANLVAATSIPVARSDFYANGNELYLKNFETGETIYLVVSGAPPDSTHLTSDRPITMAVNTSTLNVYVFKVVKLTLAAPILAITTGAPSGNVIPVASSTGIVGPTTDSTTGETLLQYAHIEQPDGKAFTRCIIEAPDGTHVTTCTSPTSSGTYGAGVSVLATGSTISVGGRIHRTDAMFLWANCYSQDGGMQGVQLFALCANAPEGIRLVNYPGGVNSKLVFRDIHIGPVSVGFGDGDNFVRGIYADGQSVNDYHHFFNCEFASCIRAIENCVHQANSWKWSGGQSLYCGTAFYLQEGCHITWDFSVGNQREFFVLGRGAQDATRVFVAGYGCEQCTCFVQGETGQSAWFYFDFAGDYIQFSDKPPGGNGITLARIYIVRGDGVSSKFCRMRGVNWQDQRVDTSVPILIEYLLPSSSSLNNAVDNEFIFEGPYSAIEATLGINGMQLPMTDGTDSKIFFGYNRGSQTSQGTKRLSVVLSRNDFDAAGNVPLAVSGFANYRQDLETDDFNTGFHTTWTGGRKHEQHVRSTIVAGTGGSPYTFTNALPANAAVKFVTLRRAASDNSNPLVVSLGPPSATTMFADNHNMVGTGNYKTTDADLPATFAGVYMTKTSRDLILTINSGSGQDSKSWFLDVVYETFEGAK